MRAKDGESDKTRFERAKQGAAEILGALREGDAAAIVLAGAPARVGLAATTDVSAARAALDGVGESDRATDLDGRSDDRADARGRAPSDRSSRDRLVRSRRRQRRRAGARRGCGHARARLGGAARARQGGRLRLRDPLRRSRRRSGTGSICVLHPGRRERARSADQGRREGHRASRASADGARRSHDLHPKRDGRRARDRGDAQRKGRDRVGRSRARRGRVGAGRDRRRGRSFRRRRDDRRSTGRRAGARCAPCRLGGAADPAGSRSSRRHASVRRDDRRRPAGVHARATACAIGLRRSRGRASARAWKASVCGSARRDVRAVPGARGRFRRGTGQGRRSGERSADPRRSRGEPRRPRRQGARDFSPRTMQTRSSPCFAGRDGAPLVARKARGRGEVWLTTLSFSVEASDLAAPAWLSHAPRRCRDEREGAIGASPRRRRRSVGIRGCSRSRGRRPGGQDGGPAR